MKYPQAQVEMEIVIIMIIIQKTINMKKGISR